MRLLNCKPLLLAALMVLALLSARCERSTVPSAPVPQAAPQNGAPPVAAANPPVTPTNPVPIYPPAGGGVLVMPEYQPPVAVPATAQAAMQNDARRAHEDGARLAVAGIRALITTQDFDNAQRLAASAARDYADTASAGELAALQQQAQASASAAAAARAQAAAAPANDQAARHARFLAARDAGIALMDRQDYAGAITQFQAALQQEDDLATRGMLQHASNFVGKPRIAVAEFEVIGDVGIADAGKAVPELMLGRFDPQRFQLVERAWLDSLLAQQGLTLAQVAQMPELLRVRRVDAVRYLVVGTVSRLGALTVSARLVDVATGQVVQTADAVAGDAVGLQNCLTELTAILQMTNEEKANYLAFRQRQSDAMAAVDPAAQAAAEAQRQAALEAQRQQNAEAQRAAFIQAQHERDAAVALADIKALFAQANYADAIRYIRWARPRFNDTTAAQELAAMEPWAAARYQEQVTQQQNAAAWAQAQAELAARHQRFMQYRDQGLVALAANDLLNAMSLLQNALNEEDNPDVRGTLDYVVRRMARPGIVVLDFDVRGDVGMPPREAPHWLAATLAQQFAGDNAPYRVIERAEFQLYLTRVGLTLADVQRDPLQPRMWLLRDQVRFLIVGTATHGSINLNTAMIDVAAGRTLQTAEFIAENVRALPDALAGTALVLQMTDPQKRAYIDQLEYNNWLARGDAAAQAMQWDIALDAYTRACRINNSFDALDRMARATQQMENTRQARRAYDTAMAAAEQSGRLGDWEQALDLYRQAWMILPTPDAKAGLDNARTRLIAAARDRHALYVSSMASGDAFARNGDWDRALDAYAQAYQVEASQEASAAVAQAQRAISDRQQARQRAYASAMNDARNAIEQGNWARALDAYTRAAAVMETRETAAGIATARRKQAEQESINKLYAAAMQDGRAAMQTNDWAAALAAHRRAAAILDTAEVQKAIDQDKKQIAIIQKRDQKVLYDNAMNKASASAAQGQWQDALASYRSAYELDKTKEASAGISQASKMLSDAAANRKQYDKAMAEGAAASGRGEWSRALAAYQQAVTIDPTAEAKAGSDRARQQVATAAAADKRRQYTQLMSEGDAAARSGDLQKALGSYTKAAAVNNTPEVQAALTGTQKKISDAAAVAAAAADKKRQYTQLMASGDAAGRAGQWDKAVDAYKKAAAIDNTAAAQADLANAQAKVSAAAAATASASVKKTQYDQLMAQGAAAGKAGDWSKALESYNQAAAVDSTPEVRTAITNARQQIAAAAAAAANADKKKQYDALMADAAAAGRAGDWPKAIDTYNKAAAVDNTPEVRTAIANARQQQQASAAAAAAADRKKQYDDLIKVATLAGQAGDWQKALDNYTKAAALDNNADVRGAINNARAQLAAGAAAADKKKQYTQLMTDGDTAAKAASWQKALDAYTKAAALDNTPEAQAGIASARAKLQAAGAAAAAAADKKAQYDAALAQGDAAGRANDWQKALDAYNRAVGIDNTPAAQSAVANAKSKLAAAGAAAAASAEKKKQYDDLIKEATLAGQANDWQKALDSYTKAAAIDNNADVKGAINNAREKLAAAKAAGAAAAAAAEKRKQYDDLIKVATLAGQAGEWQKALDAYTKAAAIDNNADVKGAINNARAQLAAAADKKKQYDTAVAAGDTAGRANDWQAAYDDYTKAAALDNTPAVQTKLANAKSKLYAKLMADGDAAAKANTWQKAVDAYTKAVALDKTPAAETALANAKKKLAGG